MCFIGIGCKYNAVKHLQAILILNLRNWIDISQGCDYFPFPFKSRHQNMTMCYLARTYPFNEICKHLFVVFFHQPITFLVSVNKLHDGSRAQTWHCCSKFINFKVHICAVRSRLLQASRSFPTISCSNTQFTFLYQKNTTERAKWPVSVNLFHFYNVTKQYLSYNRMS